MAAPTQTERRETMARVVEMGRVGPAADAFLDLARAVGDAFEDAIDAAVLRLEQGKSGAAGVAGTTLTSRVRVRAGKVLARVVSGLAESVLGFDIWDEAKWRELGEDPRAVVDGSYGITDDAYSAIVREHIDFLTGVWSADLREQVTLIVSEAVLNGGIEEAKARLREELNLSDERAQAIAHTEVRSAYEHAKWRLFLHGRERGDELEWRARGDERTRFTHVLASGQRVAVGRTFLVGGFDARFPLDPRLPASERVGCRCSLALASQEVSAVVGERALERMRNLSLTQVTP